jgi:hypothetical protein
VAVPVGAPPPETLHAPGVSVIAAESLNAWGVLMAVQLLGTSKVVPSSQLSMAGVGRVQVAPEEGEHWHAVHPLLSSTPE